MLLIQSLAWLAAAGSLLQGPGTPAGAPDTGVAPAPAVGPAVGPVVAPPFTRLSITFGRDSTQQQRPRAIEYSDAYYTRLAIHKAASYAIIPLFVGQYIMGKRLYDNPPGSSSDRSIHKAIALGVGGLFAVNTVTGLWNLWESRQVPEGRTRRYIHALLMLTADAGFTATAFAAPSVRSSTPDKNTHHRNLAEFSGSVALASYLMMLVWK
jgi:hypothetical protein